ncbi:MAG TPA: zinc ribbon domain-containing protein [Ktedonobacteraceae bacterium]|jgi:predicted amidophosphoribosyltransferase
MFCEQCGSHINDGEHFCSNCGTPLQAPGAVVQQAPKPAAGSRSRSGRGNPKAKDPYKDQIQQLRLQIRQLKLDLKQVNNQMGSTRARYNETRAFLPWPIEKGVKLFEDVNLLGSQPHKEQLQQQILLLQRQLLDLEQQQAQWKSQQLLS